MGSISFVARAQRRRRRAAAIVLAALIGLVGGLTIALVAGASRTSSVVERYFAPARSSDVGAFGAPLSRDDVRAMPGVVDAWRQVYMGALATRVDGTPYVFNVIAIDGPPWDPMVRLRAGRFPDHSDPSEVVVNETTLEEFGVALGDDLPVQLFTEDDFGSIADGQVKASGARVPLHIVGIIDTPDDLLHDQVTGGSQMANYTQGAMPFEFYEQHLAAGDIGDFGYGFEVDLADGASVQAFEDAFSAKSEEVLAEGGEIGSLTGTVQFSEQGITARRPTFNAPARVEAATLLALAVAASIAGIVVVALMLAADERFHEVDRGALAAMGMTPGERGRLALARVVPTLAAGTVLATVVAVAMSGRFPVGSVRPLERDRGIEINGAVLSVGLVVLVLTVSLVAWSVGRLAQRRTRADARAPGIAGRALATANGSASLVVGSHLAFPGKGARRAVPAWQTIAVGAAAVAIALAVAQYDASIDHLKSDRAAHGFPWDLMIGNVNFQMSEATQQVLRDDPRFVDLAAVRFGDALINGQTTEIMAMAETASGRSATIVEGRAPRTPAEVALGARLMDRLGVGIGDTVTLSLAGSELAEAGKPTPDEELTVVGKSLLPQGFGESDFADAATMTLDGAVAAGASATPQLMAAQLQPGVDRNATAADLRRHFPLWVTTDSTPAKAYSLWRGRTLLTFGAIVTAFLAAVLLLYTIATSARVMRRDLGVVRALGMRPGGVSAAVVWQGALLAAAVLVIGVPAGLIAGRFVWRVVAEQIGIGNVPTTTLWWFAVVPCTAALAILAAAVPARRARRLHVAEALHAE